MTEQVMRTHGNAKKARHRNSGRAERIASVIGSASRYYELRVMSLQALVDLYGRLRKLLPKRYKDKEFRAAATIKREVYRNSLRRARRQRAVVIRLRKAALPNR
jgi:hypothetical protein